MNIECIHFDLDSVLYIPAAFLENTLNLTVRVMIENGLQADFDEALAKLHEIRAKDSNAGNHFDQLCEHFNGCLDPIIIASGVEKYWDSKAGNMMAAPHAHYVLGRLAQNYPLSIISNGRPVKQAGKLIRLGLAHFFTRYDSEKGVYKRFFYATEDPARAKPHPYLWHQSKQDINFTLENAIMVGDRYWADMLGAKLLGMTTVKINQGEHRFETPAQAYAKNSYMVNQLFGSPPVEEKIIDLMQPDYEIDSLEDIFGVVEEIES
jgi:FMN phosphatase YigB (HAD superfamily)